MGPSHWRPGWLMEENALERIARLATRTFAVPAAAVALLDGDRFGRPGRPPDHRRFDNRYVYPSSSLPAATFLRRQGVAAACWIASGVAPDLRLYARHLADAGLEPRVLPPPSRADDGRVVEPAETAPGC